jgi:hypothetical protein
LLRGNIEIKKIRIRRGKIKMKNLIKFVMYAIVSFVVLSVVIVACTYQDPGDSKSSSKTTSSPASHITKINYDKIKQGDELSGKGGMTINDVVKILGKTDDTSETNSGDMKIETYTWTKGFTGSTIVVTFMNGKVSDKTWIN